MFNRFGDILRFDIVVDGFVDSSKYFISFIQLKLIESFFNVCFRKLLEEVKFRLFLKLYTLKLTLFEFYLFVLKLSLSLYYSLGRRVLKDIFENVKDA